MNREKQLLKEFMERDWNKRKEEDKTYVNKLFDEALDKEMENKYHLGYMQGRGAA